MLATENLNDEQFYLDTLQENIMSTILLLNNLTNHSLLVISK